MEFVPKQIWEHNKPPLGSAFFIKNTVTIFALEKVMEETKQILIFLIRKNSKYCKF
jgi:hypothetical protein